ncbi:uracil permease [Durotheca rogersii]|uniref:uracil permease n=1 Tax=Durotheca rogersii TaxID=419775 RepID=UPI00222043F1|nr:uracil permease [Durotheca rogersii]KAI5864137.1 uracil permease [Durotheca rogersii]
MNASLLRQRGRALKEKTRDRLTDGRSWILPKQTSSIAPPHVWTNADQDPVPEDKRTWTGWAFVGYWYSDLVTVSTWSSGSAIVTTGLSATDAILIVLVAAICNAVPTVLNGAIGADLHVPFPIACRASYGYRLSHACVAARAVLALFWFGVQSANGGACVTAVATAVWPGYASLPNALPAAAGVTSQGLLSYLVYWCVQFPLLLVPTHRLQYLFWAKTAVVTPTALATVVWIAVVARGRGEFFYAPPTVSGSARAWLWLLNLTSVTGGYSTLAVNVPDFSRFSRTRGAQVWQLAVIPVLKTAVGALGVVAASASREVYGTACWSPLELVGRWQGTPGGRAAAAFAGSAWLLAQVSVNVSANAVSFSNDAATLLPRWLSIRRAAVLAAVLGGWALCPWIIVSSADAFLRFMSAYAVFMAPISGIMCADYWLVARRRYDVAALYDPDGMYRYGSRWGANWRALAATAAVVLPLLPGLAQRVAPRRVRVPRGFVDLFAVNWLFGFCASVALYCALCALRPHRATRIPHTVPGDAPALRAADPEHDGHGHGHGGRSAPQTEGAADTRRITTTWAWAH